VVVDLCRLSLEDTKQVGRVDKDDSYKDDNLGDKAFFYLFLPLQEEEEEGDDNNIAIAFFVALRCNAAPEEEEEGDDINATLLSPSSLCYVAT
jgi:hypothetical protein